LRTQHDKQLSLHRLLAERKQLVNRHSHTISQYVPELTSKLAAVEGAQYIHEISSNLANLQKLSDAQRCFIKYFVELAIKLRN
jgi:hypothetical protein